MTDDLPTKLRPPIRRVAHVVETVDAVSHQKSFEVTLALRYPSGRERVFVKLYFVARSIANEIGDTFKDAGLVAALKQASEECAEI